MAKKRTVEVQLIFDTKDGSIKVKDLEGKLHKLDNTVQRVERKSSRSFQRMGTSAKKFLGPFGTAGIASGAAVAFGALTKAVIDTGMKFQSSMARVGALSGATGDELSRLTATARELGATTVFSATEAAEGMQFLAMAGFDTNQVIEAMPGLLDQAAAGQIDLGRAADITSNVLSGFGLTAAESSRVADVLTKASISSNTTIEGLGQSMQFVAPVAASLGLELEELTAATGILGDAGIQATRAGTSLRGSLLQLATPSKQQRALMDELGFSFTKADGSTKSLAEVVADLEKRTKGMTDAQRTSTLSVLVGQEAASGFTTLISTGSEKLREFTEELENAGGTAEEVAAKQIDTLEGSIKLLNSATDDLKITLFDTFSEDLQLAIDGAALSMNRFSEFSQKGLAPALAAMKIQLGTGFGEIMRFFGASGELGDTITQAGVSQLGRLAGPIGDGGTGSSTDVPSGGTGTGNTGGGGSGRTRTSDDFLSTLKKEREELIQKGEITERLITLTTRINQLERERAFVREGATIQAVEAAELEVQSVDKAVAAWERRRDAVLQSTKEEIEADQRRAAAKRELEQAERDFVEQQLMSVDLSIQSGKDLANAAADAARQAIQAQIAVLIANSLPKVGFPFNLALWPIAQAASSLALNNLIPQFATGVTNFGGGVAMVGERGPELVSLPQGSNVITNENTEKLVGAIQGSGAGTGNDFSSAINSQTRALSEGMQMLGDRIEQMEVRLNYFDLEDGRKRHNNQQRRIGNTAG